MDANYGSIGRAQARQRGRVGLATIVSIGGFLFVAIAIALAWRFGLGSGDLVKIVREEPATVATPRPVPTPSASSSEAVAAEVERVAEQQGGLDSRVAAMEQRLAKLDLQAQAAAGNAARAEGLLITFATRRAIERGQPLGYLGDQLRLRFGDAQPNAVRTVIEAAQDPVTLDQLVAQLDGLAPQLTDSNAGKDLFGWVGSELSGLFVVRRENSPSPQPERRLERARMFLRTSRPEAAVAEVRNLPNADEAAAWIADAERYAKAQRALELLETTAVLESRGLKDGAGNAVQTPSAAT